MLRNVRVALKTKTSIVHVNKQTNNNTIIVFYTEISCENRCGEIGGLDCSCDWYCVIEENDCCEDFVDQCSDEAAKFG